MPATVVTEVDPAAIVTDDVAIQDAPVFDESVSSNGSAQVPAYVDSGTTQEGKGVDVAEPLEGRMVPLQGLSVDGMNQQPTIHKLQQETGASSTQTERLNATIEVKQ
jgi:hypothetical protein